MRVLWTAPIVAAQVFAMSVCVPLYAQQAIGTVAIIAGISFLMRGFGNIALGILGMRLR